MESRYFPNDEPQAEQQDVVPVDSIVAAEEPVEESTEQSEEMPEESAEEPVEESAEEPAPLRGRARLRAKFAEDDPDTDYEDDSNFDDALDRYDTDINDRLSAYEDFDKKLRDGIDADPRYAMFLANLSDQMPLIDNLIDTMGPELADAVNSPEAKAKIDELRRAAEELDAARQANISESEAVVTEFFADKDPKDIDKFDDYVAAFFNDIAEGRFTLESLTLLWNGMKHDEDVAASAEDGEIRGRNTRIVAERKAGLSGDGIPSLRTLATSQPKQNQNDAPYDIWGRGK